MKTENNNPHSVIESRNYSFVIRHWMIALSLALLAACTSDSGNSWNAEDVCPESLRGYFTDHRDGREYKYTTIGDQVWMAENLDYKNDTYYCADKYIENYCAIYGGLYNFPEWDSIQTICPEGWHLPSKAEWEELIETMGGEKNVDKGVLMAQEGWNLVEGNKFVGTDLCGFTALPGGGGGDASWLFDKEEAHWWTSTLVSEGLAETFLIYANRFRDNKIFNINDFYRKGTNSLAMMSIRCVKNK